MALNFLGSLGGFLPDSQGGADILGGLGGLLKSLNASKTANDAAKRAINQGPTDAEKQSIALYKALLDPENSLVKRNAAIETRTGVEGLLKTLRAAQMMDARGALRGHGATFSDPERRDEFLDYAMSRGIGGIQSRAMETARTNIGNQAAGLKGFIPVQQERQNNIMQAQNNYGQYQNDQFGQGIDQLMSILRPKEKIIWNSYRG